MILILFFLGFLLAALVGGMVASITSPLSGFFAGLVILFLTFQSIRSLYNSLEEPTGTEE